MWTLSIGCECVWALRDRHAAVAFAICRNAVRSWFGRLKLPYLTIGLTDEAVVLSNVGRIMLRW